jgi:hypothetical protein
VGQRQLRAGVGWDDGGISRPHVLALAGCRAAEILETSEKHRLSLQGLSISPNLLVDEEVGHFCCEFKNTK